ncbi:MAG TPA: hypothetical protein VF937_14215, partial [Chloroflexota bacterium]
GAFTSAGYVADQPQSWDWTSPPVTSFQVHDTASGRVVMVLVYPDVAAAQTELRQAASHDQVGAGSGPHLIPGYGPSVWNANVAMVEATESQLARLYQAQADRDNGVYVDLALNPDPNESTLAVDFDFQQALDSSAVNL